MIDYAEALTVIDVNTGSFIGRGKSAGLEDTITQTNLEAAEEVVNQLRLRDIGGIIVIDFIDMARARNRDAVMKTLRKALDEDRTKTFTAEISQLGLVEMTRQNVTEGVREIMSRAVPDLRRRRRDPLRGDDRDRLRAPAARGRRRARRRRGLPRADEPARHRAVHRPRARACCTRSRHETGKSFHFEGSEGLALDHFAITFQGTREEVEERALPFRAGEEVLVEIVEPHMYDADDAVAKIDGYIISIAAPGRTSARSGWCASSRSAAPPRARCCSTRTARSCAPRRDPRRRPRRRAPRKPRAARQAPARAASARRVQRERGRAPCTTRRATPRTQRREAEASRSPSRPLEPDAPRTSPPASAGERRRAARRGRGGWRTIKASAPRPQRRTAPFDCQGPERRGVGAGRRGESTQD